MIFFCKIIIFDEGGGGSVYTVDIFSVRYKTSKTEGGVARRIFLVIGGIVSFVNNNKAKILEWRKNG